ncbi:Flp pilus assembly protein CpaB [Celeribacter ethanolicus]|uniref:Flp pilus assembly protein CpaB n=1 Tax=Celeribacter ethanolicus TaxID=1758178 RepID=A0A291G9A6_9RHOB|nr:Flp pilus assembly protein CpaB [Celeribacter ethanolicus]ATG46622.1 Flp pilus assembly protein CpaB [Celeribacter ethanolicus]
MSGFPRRATLVLATSAVVAGVVVWGGFRPNTQPTAQPVLQVASGTAETTRILVASRTVQAGDRVSPDDFHYADMTQDTVHDGFLADTSAHRAVLTGMIALRTIPGGTPFVDADLTGPDVRLDLPETLSSPTRLNLSEGMRAIALPVKAETAVAGLLELGDRVDILLSYEMAEDVLAIRTVLRNVRIIATDQTTQPPAEDAQAEPKTPPKIVTFELTPEGAKVLALADQMGDIMLVLSEDDAGEGPVIAEDAPIFSSQISGQTTKPLPTVTSRSVSIVRGAQNRVDVLLSEEQLPGGVPAAVVSVPSSSAE